jgi:hypothetical protein
MAWCLVRHMDKFNFTFTWQCLLPYKTLTRSQKFPKILETFIRFPTFIRTNATDKANVAWISYGGQLTSEIVVSYGVFWNWGALSLMSDTRTMTGMDLFLLVAFTVHVSCNRETCLLRKILIRDLRFARQWIFKSRSSRLWHRVVLW